VKKRARKNRRSKSLAFRARAIAREIGDLLVRKSRLYGDSLDHPLRIFTRKLSTVDGLAVRLEDKLARIRAGRRDDSEDSHVDAIGYHLLLLAAKRMGRR